MVYAATGQLAVHPKRFKHVCPDPDSLGQDQDRQGGSAEGGWAIAERFEAFRQGTFGVYTTR